MIVLNPPPSSLSREEFIRAYGGVYESSRWIAEAICDRRPALDRLEEMKAAMRAVVDHAGHEKQLALIRAHPELADRARVAEMTAHSKEEQKGAGLDQCTPEEFAEFQTLNRRYKEKFGFPFIIAVAGLDRRAILSAFRRRIENAPDAEFETAIEQIHRIAAIRLGAMSKA